MTIQIVDIRLLRAHERVSPARLKRIKAQIKKDRCIRHPVIADRDTFVILDGHHRVCALRELGILLIPVYFVRYSDPRIAVYTRRPTFMMRFIKRAVVGCALSGMVFPYKTTRHVLPDAPEMQAVPLERLGL